MFKSKIIVTQAVSALAAAVVMLGIDVSAETQAQLVAGILAANAVATALFRRFGLQRYLFSE